VSQIVKIRDLIVLWVQKSSVPISLLGLIYLATYAVQVLNQKNVALVQQMELVSWVIWFIFLVDLLLRAIIADKLGRFLRSNWLEIMALAIPFMRILTVLRVVLALTEMRRLFANRASASGAYLLMLVPLTWFSGALAVLDAESGNPEASITNLREALWWSLATITTVGYGDRYPVTPQGEMVAGVLMVTGIALFSAGAGIFASWVMGEKKSSS
jgi:voltage-gated potassium channel